MKAETPLVYPPSVATMRLDGGHPALELVNTLYGPPDAAVTHDVLRVPGDLVTMAGRLDLAGDATPSSSRALTAALELRGMVDAVLRARLAGDQPPSDALNGLTRALRASVRAAHLTPAGDGVTLTWMDEDPLTPAHRLTQAAVALLGNEQELARLRRCEGCRWMFLDHSRGAGRRWCSMADCGTAAKKHRYVERRRERQHRST